MKVIIEHCEPVLSTWLLLEYKYASKLIGKRNLIFSNVKNLAKGKLQRIGTTFSESIAKLPFKKSELIVLDPKARKPLKASDLKSNPVLVVGGILGEAIPLGRTHEFITKKIRNVKARNLGKAQFSIDGAILVAKLIEGGKKLSEIKASLNPEIKIRKNHSIQLGYAVPVIGKKLKITPGLIKYLKKDIVKDELKLIGGENPWQ